MLSGISKKVIFFSFLLINLLQPTKSAEFKKIIENTNIQNVNLIRTNKDSEEFIPSSSNISDDNTSFLNLLQKDLDLFLVAKAEKQQELIIQSDKQSEINDVIYAEGNVNVSYRGKLLKADTVIYDKLNKKISAKGNISLEIGDQFFKAEQLEYGFISEKGYLLNVQGFINTNTLIDDLSSNFSVSNLNEIENLLEFKKKEVLNTPSKVENWLFFTDEISIDGQTWESKKAIFSND